MAVEHGEEEILGSIERITDTNMFVFYVDSSKISLEDAVQSAVYLKDKLSNDIIVLPDCIHVEKENIDSIIEWLEDMIEILKERKAKWDI